MGIFDFEFLGFKRIDHGSLMFSRIHIGDLGCGDW